MGEKKKRYINLFLKLQLRTRLISLLYEYPFFSITNPSTLRRTEFQFQFAPIIYYSTISHFSKRAFSKYDSRSCENSDERGGATCIFSRFDNGTVPEGDGGSQFFTVNTQPGKLNAECTENVSRGWRRMDSN